MLNGSLFTRDFLIEGICGTNAWGEIDDADLTAMHARLEALLSAFGKIKNPTEAETEKELIWPTLEAIGWTEISVQQNLSAKARDDVPDALLFLAMRRPNLKPRRSPLGSGFSTVFALSRQSAGIASSIAKRSGTRARKACRQPRCCVICVASTT